MIDLDHNATTPLAPEVLEAMTAALRELPGNASSTHAAGRAAREAVEQARAEVAALIGASPEEIVFTSGGTESNDLAIRGTLRARGGGQAITSPIEHPSVLGALGEADVHLGARWSRGRDRSGRAGAAAWTGDCPGGAGAGEPRARQRHGRRALARPSRGRRARRFTATPFRRRARSPSTSRRLGVDTLAVSAHKLHGPKGVGALFIRRGLPFEPLLRGGHQERERRAGTENVAGIVGFGVAARLARAALAADAARVAGLRDRLARQLLAIPGARRNGDAAHALPGTLNVAFAGAPGQLVAAALDLEGVCVSTGAACSSASLEPSPVLLALGRSREEAASAVRFGLGRGTTEADVDRAAALTTDIVARVRARGQGGGSVSAVATAQADASSWRCPAASIRRRRRRCWSRPDTRSSASRLRLYDASGTAASVGGRCCGPRDIEDARATAARLGIPHYVIDESAAFSAAVIDDFVAEHRAGRTPNPCVRCNEKIKFGPLLAFADAVGADVLATGHYARLVPAGRRSGAGAGARRHKDQSYFLFGVRPEILARVSFPLGELTKDEVRALARRHGLPNADKPDSQQICFIPDGDHQAFVAARGGAGPAGVIVDDETGGASVRRTAARTPSRSASGAASRAAPASGGSCCASTRRRARSGSGRARASGRTACASPTSAGWTGRPPGASRRCAVQIRHHAAAGARLD